LFIVQRLLKRRHVRINFDQQLRTNWRAIPTSKQRWEQDNARQRSAWLLNPMLTTTWVQRSEQRSSHLPKVQSLSALNNARPAENWEKQAFLQLSSAQLKKHKDMRAQASFVSQAACSLGHFSST